MKIEILYFDGCPSYLRAREALEAVLREFGAAAPIEMVRVASEEDARRLCFPGSPTIRIDGEDLFPTPEGETQYALRCRVYPEKGRLAGWPSKDALLAAFRINEK